MIVRVSGLPGQIAVFPAEMFAGAFTTQDDDDDKWRVIVSVTHASSPIFGPWESADDAAACLETVLMSVGAVAEPSEPEAALETVTLALPDPVLTVDEAQRALGMAAMKIKLPGLLTGVHVVVDMTGAETTTVMAVSEIVTRLCKHGAKSIEFVTDNNGVAACIEVTLIVNKIATLLPVTLVDNSVKEPEAPEPALDTGSDPDPRDMRMPYRRYPSVPEAGSYATEVGYGVNARAVVCEWVDAGVCQCRWYPKHAMLAIRWANGFLDQCYRVHPDSTQLRVHQVSEGGKWSAWWPTTEGAKRAVFDTEEQAETFVERLAEAFEKGKA